MSETFFTFILSMIIIVIQFFIIDSHLDEIEKKINKLEGIE